MFHKNLKYLREKAFLTPQQVADALEINKARYTMLENRKASPSIETLLKLKDLYGFTIDELLCDRIDIKSIVNGSMTERLKAITQTVYDFRFKKEEEV